MNSDTFHYKRGANQTFSQPTHLVDPNQFGEDEVGDFIRHLNHFHLLIKFSKTIKELNNRLSNMHGFIR